MVCWRCWVILKGPAKQHWPPYAKPEQESLFSESSCRAGRGLQVELPRVGGPSDSWVQMESGVCEVAHKNTPRLLRSSNSPVRKSSIFTDTDGFPFPPKHSRGSLFQRYICLHISLSPVPQNVQLCMRPVLSYRAKSEQLKPWGTVCVTDAKKVFMHQHASVSPGTSASGSGRVAVSRPY